MSQPAGEASVQRALGPGPGRLCSRAVPMALQRVGTHIHCLWGQVGDKPRAAALWVWSQQGPHTSPPGGGVCGETLIRTP